MFHFDQGDALPKLCDQRATLKSSKLTSIRHSLKFFSAIVLTVSFLCSMVQQVRMEPCAMS
jgi:hypothetical protein